MKVMFVLIAVLIFTVGCARVRVEAPKEPIKVDISMRLDIYQHVQKDIDTVEDIVTGTKEKGNQSFLGIFISNAYAEENLSPEVKQAALRRKERYDRLNNLKSSGVVGENRLGLVEIRKSAEVDFSVTALVKSENADRMIIYEAIAKKNNISVTEMEKIYAQRLQSDSPSGTPIEIYDEISGNFKWKIK